MKIGKHEFDLKNEAYIMGILNVTPDSFSDGGRYRKIDTALWHTEKMIKEGASIIDVGGESTRPGYKMIADSEEIERIVPVIEAVKSRFDIAISLDTYKSQVALAGIKAGADLINDIWGFKYDKDMAHIVAETGVVCCLMHNKKEAVYNEYVSDVLMDMKECVDIARSAGVKDDKIILDPGVGFGKTYQNNLEIINKCDKLLKLGYPLLLGTSRKSVIGITLETSVNERVYGTIATTVVGYERGCRLFRVHDVKENIEALKMVAAINKY